MSDDRLLVPQDLDYFHAIGLAAVAFARLEWNAVWCCHRLQTNYIQTIEPARMTAGTIAKDLMLLFLRILDENLRAKALSFADEFKAIVPDRNAKMHGKPGTATNGDQRLFRHGCELTINDVNDFSDRCVTAGRQLNDLLHNDLLHNELAETCTVVLTP
ncbi:hypothetical protein [Roseobacter sp. N2S]|uniref:hypothetical protein n=1 Tax=Roseobacter sp. N2S TaxID=2663844 RepID=UPI00285CE765|nr:hypothetical protein [Roseobacter sp. N2S]MDR6263933.1 hypothetical protein [Roseobacter sp. N2S]